MVMGTVGYMSPEQVRGDAADARSDIFSFGVVLYELLSGQRPFIGDTAVQTMNAILTEDPPEIVTTGKALPPALERVVRHCLEKKADERFQSARDLAFALDALSSASGTATTMSGAARSDVGPSPTRPRLGLVALAAVAGAALLVGGATGHLVTTRLSDTASAIANVSYQPVTFDEGFVYAARFAGDGKTIAYSADWDGRPRDIFVTSVERPEVRALGLTGADLLSLSATGDLAILSDSILIEDYVREGTLSRTTLAGGPPRHEAEYVRFADIAADDAGAIVRRNGDDFALEFPAGHVLATAPFGIFVPRVSPSGRDIAAFVYDDAGRLSVQVFARAGGLLFEGPPLANWWGLAWRSDAEVWFAASAEVDVQDRASLYSLNRSGTVRRLLQCPGAATLHDVSATGEVLARSISCDPTWSGSIRAWRPARESCRCPGFRALSTLPTTACCCSMWWALLADHRLRRTSGGGRTLDRSGSPRASVWGSHAMGPRHSSGRSTRASTSTGWSRPASGSAVPSMSVRSSSCTKRHGTRTGG
jgi:hypothetical protein